jgi:glutamate-1-semialdehyde 2,1-aminomutase
MPYLERIRFTNTGSEADRSVVRLARAVTGRPLIAKFEGHYHGSEDALQVSAMVRRTAGPRERPTAILDSAGVPPSVLADTLVLPFNDIAHTTRLIDEHADRLAAVIMEPVGFSSGGAIPAEPDFAEAVRGTTSRSGILLIFDEIVTGLRLGLAGAPAYLGVTPDLSCLGKALGGGFPLACFGGRADVMEAGLGVAADERQRIFQSGTYTGNPISIAAGMAVLDVLESEPVLEHVDAVGASVRNGLSGLFTEHGATACMTGMGSIFQVHFTSAPPRDRRDILAGDAERTRLFLLGLVAEGVLWPPVHPGVTAAPHTDADVDQVIDAAERVLRVLSS